MKHLGLYAGGWSLNSCNLTCNLINPTCLWLHACAGAHARAWWRCSKINDKLRDRARVMWYLRSIKHGEREREMYERISLFFIQHKSLKWYATRRLYLIGRFDTKIKLFKNPELVYSRSFEMNQ